MTGTSCQHSFSHAVETRSAPLESVRFEALSGGAGGNRTHVRHASTSTSEFPKELYNHASMVQHWYQMSTQSRQPLIPSQLELSTVRATLIDTGLSWYFTELMNV